MKVFLHVTFQIKIFTLQTFDETLKYNAFLLTKTEVANLSDLWLTKKQRSFVTPCDISDGGSAPHNFSDGLLIVQNPKMPNYLIFTQKAEIKEREKLNMETNLNNGTLFFLLSLIIFRFILWPCGGPWPLGWKRMNGSIQACWC